jgi:DNA/RNA endonuclease YhcR with UshA esterase domain
LVLSACAVDALQAVAPGDAMKHVGQHATICGLVASARYDEASRGSPTFLNLDQPYPSHVFSAVIWDGSRAKFSSPPEGFEGSRICVSGTIEAYRGKAQIEVSNPSQITNAP